MKKVVSETFVSFDGYKFDDEECCEKYEGRVVNGAWRVFPKARVDATRFGIGKKEDECYVVIPKTQEDLDMLNAYIRRELFYATDFSLLKTSERLCLLISEMIVTIAMYMILQIIHPRQSMFACLTASARQCITFRDLESILL